MPPPLWLPLESNPELLTLYVRSLGVSGPYQFQDVFGVDHDILNLVPGPPLAVCLLFPLSEASEDHARREQERIEEKGQVVDKDLYFIRQTVGNACGTIAVIHAILNNYDFLDLDENKFFGKFLKETKELDENERAKRLETNKDIESGHQAVAELGQSSIEDVEDVNLHFLCFTVKGGHLYELDGRKKFPINHGPSSPETLLYDAVAVIKEFMKRDPDNVRFNIIVLAPPEDDQ